MFFFFSSFSISVSQAWVLRVFISGTEVRVSLTFDWEYIVWVCVFIKTKTPNGAPSVFSFSFFFVDKRLGLFYKGWYFVFLFLDERVGIWKRVFQTHRTFFLKEWPYTCQFLKGSFFLMCQHLVKSFCFYINIDIFTLYKVIFISKSKKIEKNVPEPVRRSDGGK